ncbi:LysR substrate-binding domain-containing protein [Pantoea sp. LMR881]|uniref:LysR family transcriptional regulator n=1 Tax=Pantoea sp. LMR881 TaxID=3014336 RepID=UPI0022AEA2CB|nr:LysR substrate-binding domain-containing protein [Pantoea sp. LMR881]MCZ4061073.1 LysR substrate-binding domain-containing protein [Pantoea sp. LMR881]
MRYDLVSLSIFVAVAEEQNLTRAAHRKHTAVSAVSKRIAELEQQAGTQLMLRLPRGVELTPAGHSLLYHARQVFRNLEQMEEELSDYAAGIRGHIRIYTISAALMHYLPRAVGQFLNHYPQTDIDIEEHTGIGVVQGLIEGSADVGIFSSWTAAAGIEAWPWQQDQLAVLVWPEHRLAERASLQLTDIIDEKIIGPHRDSAVSHILEREARKLGKVLTMALRVSSFVSMAELVSHQPGIAVLPVNEIAPSSLHRGLRSIPLAEPWAKRDLLIGVKNFSHASPSVKTLIKSLIPAVKAGAEETNEADESATLTGSPEGK